MGNDWTPRKGQRVRKEHRGGWLLGTVTQDRPADAFHNQAIRWHISWDNGTKTVEAAINFEPANPDHDHRRGATTPREEKRPEKSEKYIPRGDWVALFHAARNLHAALLECTIQDEGDLGLERLMIRLSLALDNVEACEVISGGDDRETITDELPLVVTIREGAIEVNANRSRYAVEWRSALIEPGQARSVPAVTTAGERGYLVLVCPGDGQEVETRWRTVA